MRRIGKKTILFLIGFGSISCSSPILPPQTALHPASPDTPISQIELSPILDAQKHTFREESNGNEHSSH